MAGLPVFAKPRRRLSGAQYRLGPPDYFSESRAGSGGSSPPAPSLPQVAHIITKWQARTLALSNGATVTSWVDSVGGLSAISDTGTPTFQTNQFNSLPSVRFDGASDLKVDITGSALQAALNSGTVTVLVNFRTRGATTVGGVIGDGFGGNSFLMLADGTYVGRHNGSAPNISAVSNGSGFNTLAESSDGSLLIDRCYLNGGCYYEIQNKIPFSGGNTLGIGALGAGGYFPGNNDIMDIYFWDVPLTPYEQAQAQYYFFHASQYNQTMPQSLASYLAILDGNSLEVGYQASIASKTSAYLTAQALGLLYGQWSLVAQDGIDWNGLVAKIPDWSGIGALYGKNMKVYVDEYINSILDGLTQAQIIAKTAQYYSIVKALPNTKVAMGTSMSCFNDNPAGDAVRLAICNIIAASPATYGDTIVRLDLNTSVGLNGPSGTNSFSVNGGGAGLNLYADTIHLNDAGYVIRAPLVTAGLNALPG